jgi:hypothetical protein
MDAIEFHLTLDTTAALPPPPLLRVLVARDGLEQALAQAADTAAHILAQADIAAADEATALEELLVDALMAGIPADPDARRLLDAVLVRLASLTPERREALGSARRVGFLVRRKPLKDAADGGQALREALIEGRRLELAFVCMHRGQDGSPASAELGNPADK